MLKVIIINRIPYSSKHNDLAVQQLNVAISELPNGQNVLSRAIARHTIISAKTRINYMTVSTWIRRGTINWLSFGWTPLSVLLLSPSRTSRALSIGDYSKGSGDDLTYSVDKSTSWFVASMADKSGVLIDGQTLSQDAYSVTSGEKTTAVTIHADYLRGFIKWKSCCCNPIYWWCSYWRRFYRVWLVVISTLEDRVPI